MAYMPRTRPSMHFCPLASSDSYIPKTVYPSQNLLPDNPLFYFCTSLNFSCNGTLMSFSFHNFLSIPCTSPYILYKIRIISFIFMVLLQVSSSFYYKTLIYETPKPFWEHLHCPYKNSIMPFGIMLFLSIPLFYKLLILSIASTVFS